MDFVKELLNSIKQTSPRLAGILTRTKFIFEDKYTLEDIIRAYSYSLANGGNLEIDYTRPPGQAYNPRVARIMTILIQNAKIYSAREIIISALSSCLVRERILTAEFAPDVVQSAKNINSALTESIEYLNNLTEQELLIASVHWLDKLRHLHLANIDKTSDLETKNKTTFFYNKISVKFPGLALYFC
ncbi:MAG: hypothetical protein LBE20_04070 [Deltaproteobacteria bacterium]|jgi:hypothetical protein|nr:hypothetical protein [Deltaproteobacteria bacterium]